jgi:rSAM/selenodomain-associated transferase 2
MDSRFGQWPGVRAPLENPKPKECYRPSVDTSVVIPTLDEEEQIAAAIRSATAPGVEVIVVDAGSMDDTRRRAQAAGAQVMTSPTGRARQLSAGVSRARGDVIVFLHADTRLPIGFADAIRMALRDPAFVGGAFRFRFDHRTLALRVVEWGTRARVALLGLPYGDQALFVRRAVLDAIGGLPDTPVMEDLDLVRAMRQRGRLAYLRDPATTSARRHRAYGVFRTAFRHGLAASAWRLGLDRARIAAWLGR